MIYSRYKDKLEIHGDKVVPWWSFGKTVLALACMKLVEQGQLSLDEHYFDRPGSLRQLLRHEAGEGDYSSLKAYHEAVARNDQAWLPEDMLRKVDPVFLPGTSWQYSNIGYYYVRKVIEDTCHLPLEDALKVLVFDPLDIEAWVVNKPGDLQDVDHVQAGYHPGWLYHGMIVGKLSQVCKLLHLVATGHLLKPESLQEMLVPYILDFKLSDRPWEKPAYGLGFMMDMAYGSFGHTGGGPDSVLAVYHFPETQTTCAAALGHFDQGQVEFKTEALAYN